MNPESGTISYSYDANGNLTRKIDARGAVTCFGNLSGSTCDGSGYDALNRSTFKSYSATSPVTPYVFWTWGTTAPQVGRLTSVTSPPSTTTFGSYDALGRPGSSTQTTTGGNGSGYSFSYQYYPIGLKTTGYPSGRSLTYSYDSAGRPSGVTGSMNGVPTSYATSLSYASHGAVQQINLGNSKVEQTCFNTRLQPVGIRLGSGSTGSCVNGGSDLLNLSFGYGSTNNNGNVQSQTITRSGVTWYHNYSYTDGLNHLTSATESRDWTQSYTYDVPGNRAVSGYMPYPGSTPQSLSAYNSNNRWTGAGYDAADNQTALPSGSFTYDAESRVTSATESNMPSILYSYDGDGRRISKTVGGTTTIYVYDAQGQMAAEYATTAPVETYPLYLTADHLGSTRLVTNPGGAAQQCFDYFPFGEEIVSGTFGRSSCFPSGVYPINPSSDVLSQKFTRLMRDAETGLDYFGARYMSSAQGRFTSPDYTAPGSDPVPVPGADLDNPQSLNLYSYVRNSPVTNLDPDGHDCVVQTRNSETSETVSVTAGNCDKINVEDGQTKTYIAGTVDTNSIASNGSGGITFGYTPYSGGGGVADLNAAPVPDRPGIAPGWGNNAQGYQQIAAAGRFINNTAAVYAVAYGGVLIAAAAPEIAAATSAARSGIIFRLAHGMRLALGHSHVLAEEGAIKNAIAAAIGSGAIQRLGTSAFQGVVNVAGTYIKFTGAFTPSGVVVSNVMGAALQK